MIPSIKKIKKQNKERLLLAKIELMTINILKKVTPIIANPKIKQEDKNKCAKILRYFLKKLLKIKKNEDTNNSSSNDYNGNTYTGNDDKIRILYDMLNSAEPHQLTSSILFTIYSFFLREGKNGKEWELIKFLHNLRTKGINILTNKNIARIIGIFTTISKYETSNQTTDLYNLYSRGMIRIQTILETTKQTKIQSLSNKIKYFFLKTGQKIDNILPSYITKPAKFIFKYAIAKPIEYVVVKPIEYILIKPVEFVINSFATTAERNDFQDEISKWNKSEDNKSKEKEEDKEKEEIKSVSRKKKHKLKPKKGVETSPTLLPKELKDESKSGANIENKKTENEELTKNIEAESTEVREEENNYQSKKSSPTKFTPLVEIIQQEDEIEKINEESSGEEVTALFDDEIELDDEGELGFEEVEERPIESPEKTANVLTTERQNLENEHKALEHESKALDEGLREVSAISGNNPTLGGSTIP
jgi:hypothetical protein